MTEPTGDQSSSNEDPFAKPPPPLAGAPAQGPTPAFQKPPRKFAPSAVAAGIAVGFFGMLVLEALVYIFTGSVAGAYSIAQIQPLFVVAAAVVPGAILVRNGSPKRRGWGMGLLLSVAVAFVVLPVIGLIVCVVLLSGSGY